MKLIVGNWKMFPETAKEAASLFSSVRAGARGVKTKIVLCPPLSYMGLFSKSLSGIALGAQDLSVFSKVGARTGEVSGEMIASLGARYVIIGHSERRAMGESDETIAQKIRNALASGLYPILCVGEKERHDDARHFHVMKRQLHSAFEGMSKSVVKYVVIAYEPVWAIGAKAKSAANPEIVREMTMYIRKELSAMFGKAGRSIPILYGGSVDEKNAGSYVGAIGTDGLLVGRASLDAKRFLAIAQSV